MTDKKNSEKKGQRILLLIVLAYALIVTGVVIYVKLDKEGYFNKNQALRTEAIIYNVDSLDSETRLEAVVTEKEEGNDIQLPGSDSIIIEKATDAEHPMDKEPEAEDLSQDLEAVDLDYTIADVPARTRSESVIKNERKDTTQNNIVEDEVLSAENLALDVEKPKGFIEKVFDFFGNLFFLNKNDDNIKTDNAEIEPVQSVDELNNEIEELKSKFTFDTEGNMTWIDHIDRPSNNQNAFYIYIGINSQGFAYNRIVLQYGGPESIADFNTISIQTDLSDSPLIINVSEYVQGKDKASQGVRTERIDLPPTTEYKNVLKVISKANVVKVTFMGDKNKEEWTMPENELSNLKESIYFYELLKKKEKIEH